MNCGCYVKYEGMDHMQRPIENGIVFCPLHAHAEEMQEALQSVDIYFKSLCEQWAANEGRVVSESGTVIDACKEIQNLCEIAAEKVVKALAAANGGKA